MPELNVTALPGQHVCSQFLKNDWYINCDVKIYRNWSGAGPMMIVNNSQLMVKINHCPLCGDKFNK